MTVTIQRTARSTYPPAQPRCPPLYLLPLIQNHS